MTAVLTTGGPIQQVVGAAPAAGNWALITIAGLPTGQYTVMTQMIVKNACGVQVAVISAPLAVVNVP